MLLAEDKEHRIGLKDVRNSCYSVHKILVNRMKQLFGFISTTEILTALRKRSWNFWNFFIKTRTRPRLLSQDQNQVLRGPQEWWWWLVIRQLAVQYAAGVCVTAAENWDQLPHVSVVCTRDPFKKQNFYVVHFSKFLKLYDVNCDDVC